ncbi:MAG: hypothetical protein K9M11_04735 [Candidatus Pacebacteria bacterium]|nr:hypothetical protein [Candidatus Paceibacterota bacterium]
MNSFGLSEKSLNLYKAAIGSGVTTVAHLSQITNIKRPTAYIQLQELITRGLVEKIQINKKTYFKACDPKILLEQVALDQITIESLSDTYQKNLSHLGKPQVRVLEGITHVRELYKEIGSSKSLRVWSNIGGVYHIFEDTYIQLAEMINERQINTKEIIADNKSSIRYAKHVRQISGSTYKFKTSPSKDIENDTIIFDNCVAIFRLQEKNVFAIRIEDVSISNTFKSIFDASWSNLKER